MFTLLQLILYIISLVIMFGTLLSLIIKYYYGFSEYQYIWFCSKILTVKKMIEKNNNKDIVFSHYYEGDRYVFSQLKYLNYLERIDNNGDCLYNYKKCGILDTYGNSICFSQSVDCPINEMIFDSNSASIKTRYQNDNYDYYTTDRDNIYLYYKKGVPNKGVILTPWLIRNSQPKYINNQNFIFDMDAFKEIFGSPKKKDDDDDDDDDDDYDDDDDEGSEIGKEILEGTIDLIEDVAKMARINKLIKYINDKINNDEKNIDYNYTYINLNNYVKNYMGFGNLEAANNFKKINFNIYKSRYPNYTALIFSIICGIIILFLIIMNIFIIIRCDEKCGIVFSVISIILYCLTFFGFFIYSIVIYAVVFKNEVFEMAKEIKADKFIEDFLKEFYEPFENTTFIICIIIGLSVSSLILILSWIIRPLIECIERRITERNQYERRIRYENQRNININQVRVPYSSQYNNRQELNPNIEQINTHRRLNNEQLDTNNNQIENNNNNAGVNNEKNVKIDNEKIKTEDNKNLDNPITDINELIIEEKNENKNDINKDNKGHHNGLVISNNDNLHS